MKYRKIKKMVKTVGNIKLTMTTIQKYGGFMKIYKFRKLRKPWERLGTLDI